MEAGLKDRGFLPQLPLRLQWEDDPYLGEGSARGNSVPPYPTEAITATTFARSIDFNVGGEGIWHYGVQVGESADTLNILIVNGDGGLNFNILAHDPLGLF